MYPSAAASLLTVPTPRNVWPSRHVTNNSRRFERSVLKIEITKDAEPKNATFQSSGETPDREVVISPMALEKASIKSCQSSTSELR
jgi:hypothetical protein